MATDGLTMREMSQRSGVTEASLRMWENRHGFPRPDRLPSGHRRYSEDDLERVLSVVRAREQGLSLPTAIARAAGNAADSASLYAAVTRRHPALRPQLLPKQALIAASHAIEDECAARGERPLLIGCFQEERFYRAAEPRWSELARTAGLSIVLAAFDGHRDPGGGAPIEIAIGDADPVRNEWAVIVQGSRFAACLLALERPGGWKGTRAFEGLWTVDPAVVSDAAHALGALASQAAPGVGTRLEDWLNAAPVPTADIVADAMALSGRIVRYVAVGPAG